MKMMRMAATKEKEKGATLLAMLALMTLIAFSMITIAPMVVQDIQRQKELEQIRRGEEVAEAIRQYVTFYNGAKLPQSMDDLLEGLPQGTKKKQILRRSSAIDPLSEDGKWRLIKADGSKSLLNFARRIQNYNGGATPSNPDPPSIWSRYSLQFANNLNTGTEEEIKDADSAEEIDDTTENVPFIGVVSASKQHSVIAYYGLENHSKWVYTPLFRGQGISQIQPNRGGVFGAPTPATPREIDPDQ